MLDILIPQCILYGIHVSQIYTYFSRVRWRSVPRTAFGLGNGNGNGNGNSGSGGSNSLPPAATAPLAHRLVVLWVFTLSTLHVFMIVMPSGYWYFVGGLREPERWGRFYWLLSVQDGVVSLTLKSAAFERRHRRLDRDRIPRIQGSRDTKGGGQSKWDGYVMPHRVNRR